jgi:sterol desaturase/sphingolipid hydroxylase (fatty acid hydroxylase superfamily)
MNAFVASAEFYRAFFSLGGLAFFLTLGWIWAYRKNQGLYNKERWFNNLALTFGNGLLVYAIVPITLIELSLSEAFKKWSLINFHSDQFWLQFIFGMILLDLVIYWQHRLTHKIPLLWRLHRVHHSDIEFDTTTAGRFHTLEIFFSFIVKGAFVVLFDLNASTIVAFEILLNFSSLFNHTNIHFPSKVEKVLRWFVITPDLHRIHHSTYHNEMNRNFGFSISIWDRIFKSFKGQGREDQQEMIIGLRQFRSKKSQSLWGLIKQPLVQDK